jgi:hypothetical protein
MSPAYFFLNSEPPAHGKGAFAILSSVRHAIASLEVVCRALGVAAIVTLPPTHVKGKEDFFSDGFIIPK